MESNGPLIGIYTGLKASGSKYSYIIGCDMPNVNLAYIKYMKQRLEENESLGIITRFEDSIEPFNGFYSRDLIGNLLEAIKQGQRSIYRLINKLDFQYVEEIEARKYSPNWDMFSNLNTPEDLREYISK